MIPDPKRLEAERNLYLKKEIPEEVLAAALDQIAGVPEDKWQTIFNDWSLFHPPPSVLRCLIVL